MPKRTARASAPEPKRRSKESQVFDDAATSLRTVCDKLGAIDGEFGDILCKDLAAISDRHDATVAALASMPAVAANGTMRPEESYDAMMARADRNINEAGDALNRVFDDPSVKQWVRYLAALADETK